MRTFLPCRNRVLGWMLLLSLSPLLHRPSRAGIVSIAYFPLSPTSVVNLTATGTLDWVKWGDDQSGANWTNVRKAGVTPIIQLPLSPLGTAPPGTTVVLRSFAGAHTPDFTWTDGNAPVTGSSGSAISETILPAQFDYPIGLGLQMTALASSDVRVMDLFAFGFNASMRVTASMSGGGSDVVEVAPSVNPPNDPQNNYALGRFRVVFTGAAETLTVSTVTVDPRQPGSVGFPNSGVYAAAILGGIDADFNDDGSLDCADIDALVADVAGNDHFLGFDLTGDGAVDVLDVDRWLADAGAVNLASHNPYSPGDANLDGNVDGSDFGIWNSHKFTMTPAWCSGDFNANGSVDGSDFGIWNSNKFTTADHARLVPEPHWGILSVYWLILVSRRRRPEQVRAVPASVRLHNMLRQLGDRPSGSLPPLYAHGASGDS